MATTGVRGGSASRRASISQPRAQPGGDLTFVGRDALHARRVALGWWYQHREKHGLVANEFFSRCRQSLDGRTIWFSAR